MLDTVTKRRIDTCRDILVGKVPDPKSQVEQITVALIYKFMDDMDLESEELGGERKFFTKDYERYRWSRLVAPGVSGQEMLNTYSEALTKMVENENLPELFRTIFRNAYLPYRDPETLRSFLREINNFTYDHSEKLGDAFEYLLSVLGSQGDAGQFRTPRHIIDFMVEIIDPKKTEVIMDPACGTAGFLISAYKHILKSNSTGIVTANSNGQETDAAEQALESPLRYPGDLLTPEERKQLAHNIKGYDISPDMVRLSLVNLYLHGFADPKVEEYDTLTSEEKWTEMADVILANPPFMSPKGGIKPHTRFQVQSKRSEVLFVDYMAEHLTPQGRAAIIVPEGIIFQSQSAYVALRKMLVDNHLAAVISLPAGVFNPYSGVKTSVLILDRAVAKASKHVAFFKIDNDGFALGAQRKAVKGSNLPQVKGELSAWLAAVRAGAGAELESSFGQIVDRAQIAVDGDYNLSVERYREKVALKRAWPMVPLEEVTKRKSGGTPSKANPSFWEGEIPWVSPKDMKADQIFDTIDHVSQEAVSNSATTVVPRDTILCVVRSGILQHTFPVALTAREMCFNQDLVALLPQNDRLLPLYLFWNLKGRSTEILAEGIKPGVTVQSFHSGYFKNFQIPLPPIEIQHEIVAEIESYQRVIDGAQAVIDNYRPHIPVDPEWPTAELRAIADLVSGQHIEKEDYNRDGDGIGYLTGPDDFGIYSPSISKWTNKPKVTALPNDILITVKGSGLGKVNILEDVEVAISRQLMAIRVHGADTEYVWTWLRGQYNHIQSLGAGAAIPGITREDVLSLKLPLPPNEIQVELVAHILAEQIIVDGNRDLIARFEKKIEAAIARIWGEAKEAAE